MKNPIRIAVTSRAFAKNAVLRSKLLEKYSNVTFNDTGKILAGEELSRFLQGHEKAIVSLERVDGPLLEKLPELEVISKYGVGLDSIDLKALKKSGKKLGWQGGINKRSVSELTLSLMINALRSVGLGQREILQGLWNPRSGAQLSGKTVGIIGCGHVGKDLVRLLQPFHCEILAFDKLDFPDFYQEFKVRPAALSILLERSDVVTVHVPYTEETHHLLGEKEFAQMKHGVVVVNTARGNIVDETALKAGLFSGRVKAAAFDVLCRGGR